MAKSDQKDSKREMRRKKQKRQKTISQLIWGFIGIVALGVIGLLIWNGAQSPIGEQVTLQNAGHVPDGSPLPEYNSNPPTSGTHYPTPLPEGFYDENSQEATNLANPEGYIVHSMEHGYVIFWYNCTVLEDTDCTVLKDQIRSTMEDFNNFKLIAFPWTTTDFPVVATSWGRMLEMDSFDIELATEFIQKNRNQAPESNVR